MLKDLIAQIAMGQCGGNLVYELEKLDNQAFYINSSLDDLKTIPTDSAKKYCIEHVKGMAKDIEYAEEVITTNYNDEKIVEAIYERYPNQRIYNFHFGLSGGTGGGMSVTVMRTFKEFHPNKIINVICVYPHDEEGMLMQYNAEKCLKKLKECMEDGIINSLQILNNNSKEIGEKLTINAEYARLYDEIVSFEGTDVKGNLDKEEMERLLSTNGVTVLYKLKNEDVGNNLSKLEENTIYAPFHRNPSTLGLLLSEEQDNALNRDLIEKAFGVPMVTHDVRWKNEYSFIISAGMKFNDDIITHLRENFNKLHAKKKELETPISNKETKEVKIDESILSALSKKQTVNISSDRPRRRRGGAVGLDAENKRYS